MHWKKKTLIIIIAFSLFYFVYDWVRCKGMCGPAQQNTALFIFVSIVLLTAVFLYYSLSLWMTYKKKYKEIKEKKETK
jgi:multisubunit Na+/H+ antiporter MnhB subunit